MNAWSLVQAIAFLVIGSDHFRRLAVCDDHYVIDGNVVLIFDRDITDQSCQPLRFRIHVRVKHDHDRYAAFADGLPVARAG